MFIVLSFCKVEVKQWCHL